MLSSRPHLAAAAAVLIVLSAASGCERTRPGAAILVINEVMARNGDFLHKDYPALPADARVPLDWAEIYNPSDAPITLAGYSLSDNPDRPRRYEFPGNLVIAPRSFVVVSFATDADRAQIAAQQDAAQLEYDAAQAALVTAEANLAQYPVRGVAGVEAAQAALDLAEAFLTEVLEFRFGGLHADFGLSGSQDTLYLFANGHIASEARIFNLPEDASNGRSPDGGADYGIQVAPTPGDPNGAIGLAPRFPVGGEPLAALCVDEGEPIPIDFTIVQDAAAQLPFVRLRYVVTQCHETGIHNDTTRVEGHPSNCDERFDGGPGDPPAFIPVDPLPGIEEAEILPPVQMASCAEFSTVDDIDAVDPDCEVAVAISGGLRSTRTLHYRAFLPAMAAGENVQWRLEIADELGEQIWCRCYTYRIGCVPLVISEYQPRNASTMLFVCETCIDVERVRTPDWLEIHNYGSEPIDLASFGLAGRNAFRRAVIGGWSFFDDTRAGDPGGVNDGVAGDSDYTVIGPGECRLILADGDGGTERRIYRRLVDGVPDMSCRYYSARFSLTPARDGEPDEFALVYRTSNGPIVLDRAILDFSRYASERGLDSQADTFLVDRAAARFPLTDHPDAQTPADRYPPFALTPGTVTDCPTPAPCRGSGLDCENRLDCDRFPAVFLDAMTFAVVDAAEAWRRCPQADESVRVTAWAAVDPRFGFDAELVYTTAAGEVTLGRGDPGVVFEIDPSRADEAPPGRDVYRLEFTIPPQPAGTVTFEVRLRDGDDRPWTALSSVASEMLSFTYASGTEPLVEGPRLNEVLPRSNTLPDYVELTFPADAETDVLALDGYYLSAEADATSAVSRPRRWPLPAGAQVERGGYLVLVFGSDEAAVDGAVSVSSEGLDDEAQTLYLIGPDAAGNCVVDRMTYDVAGDPRLSPAVGYVCDAPGIVRAPASPGADNVLPTLPDSVWRSGNDACRTTVSATLFVQETFLARAGWTLELPVSDFAADVIPVVEFRLASGSTVGDVVFADADPDEIATEPPSGYYAVRVDQDVLLAGDGGTVGVGVVIEDRCGRRTDFCADDESELCFWIDGPTASLPAIRIGEMNRSFPVPGGDPGAPRRWIELHNESDDDVSLGSASLTNDLQDPWRAVLPGAVVPARGALLVLTDGGAALDGPGAPPHVVVDLDWLPVEGARCGFDPDSPDDSPAAIGLWLLDIVSGCPTDAIVPGAGVTFPNPDCDDGTSLGYDADAGTFVALDAPTPGTVGDAPPPVSFIRGDSDDDTRLTLNDAVSMLRYLFGGGDAHPCLDAHDADDSGILTVADPVLVLNHLFRRGPAPTPPYPDPGVDPTADELRCDPR